MPKPADPREVDFMDIAALATGMSMANISTEIGTAVLAQNLDMIETLGEGMTKMMELSVNPHIGGNIDISV